MNIDEMLMLIDETLDEGVSIPFPGGKRMVDVDKIRDILDDIRNNLPDEIAQAKNIVNDRAQILANARSESETIIKKAETRARTLVSEQEIVKASQQRAVEIESAAHTQAREFTNKINLYCENVLKTTEEQMTRNAETLAKNAAAMRAVRTNMHKTPQNG